MGFPHVGNQSEIGLGHVDQLGYVAGVTGSHFDDGHLAGVIEPQQGERHTDGIVEISLGGKHLEPTGERCGHQLLGRGLPIGAGDTHHGASPLAAMASSQGLQSLQYIVDQDITVAGDNRGVVDHGIGTTGLQRSGGKTVTVEGIATQSKKQCAGRAIPTIGRHATVRLEQAI